jgi:hypothetical protein
MAGLLDIVTGRAGLLDGGISGALSPGLVDKRQERESRRLQQLMLMKQLSQPTASEVDDPQRPGYKIPILRYPDGRVERVQIPGPSGGAPGMGQMPAGGQGNTLLNSRVADEARTKAAVEQEADLVKSAATASRMLPQVDEMLGAYEKMNKAGAIGPFVGSEAGRFLGKFLPSDPKMNPFGSGALFPGITAEAEAARQNYERRKSPIQAYITSAQNKGQGPVSEWERKLFGLALPGFTDLDPQEQIRVINDLRETMVSDMKSGRASPLSATPAMSQEMNRGAQQQGQTVPSPGRPDKSSIINEAKQAVQAGRSRSGVAAKLKQMGIDPAEAGL